MTININYLKTRVVRYPLAILASGSALIVTGLDVGLNKSEWAYWVQAIGSIAAILGAFAVARWQAKSSERKSEADRAASSAALGHIAHVLAADASACLDSIVAKFELIKTERRPAIGTERLEEILHALRVFSAKDVPSTIYIEIVVIQREVVYTLTAVREQNKMKTISADRMFNAEARAKKVMQVRDKLFIKWQTLNSSTGFRPG